MHNRPVPDESDTALLYVDRGLVRADDGPPDQRAQRRAHARARAARRVRWAVPAALLLAVLAAWPVGSAPLFWLAIAVLLVAGVAMVVLTRAARVAHAVAGLPVPIEITGKVATALRSVLAMTRGIAGQRALRRSGAAAEGMRVLRDWSTATDGLRTSWLRGDVAAWHEHARTLAATGARADRVRADLESGPGDSAPGRNGPGGPGDGDPGSGGTRDSGN
ncbi:hypothetical protein SAMN05216207_101511 [Pseudonocardia ammonioxydans]|uniref:Uncharacterized protein n=1 Tax=Pseudonocardia ammonioxydans TaxID=260086 RepID=A0A1I4ZCX4_PSUAM|nr:hypothetical protein SAMN05216207_101511 [Pseudonocardia ammonioxydans]